MGKRIASFAAFLPPLALLTLLLLAPSEASAGAQRGLSVCAGVIVPSLFPFLLLSSYLTAMGLPAALGKLAAPLLSRLSLPAVSAAPFLLGLCGGYPAGASAVAALVRSGALTPEEGARLLPCCNNTGPGFLIGVAGAAVFGSVRLGALLYLSHVLAALTLLLLSGRRRAASVCVPTVPAPRLGSVSAFPACVSGAAETTLHICGYVVFFSVLTALLQSVGLISALAGAMALRFGMELRVCLALLSGLLELGSGVAALRGAAPTPANLALAAFLLGFGGLAVHAQTLYAVSGTQIKCARHFAGRIIHGLLSAVYVLFFLALFRRPRI